MAGDDQGQRQELRPHGRDEDPPTDAIVAVGGGPAAAANLTSHARRTHAAFSLDGQPLWGVSVACALDDIGAASLDGLLRRFPSYRAVHVPTVGQLTATGFYLLPTFQRPHFALRPHCRDRNRDEALARRPRRPPGQPVPWWEAAGKETEMTEPAVGVDITCDLMDEDETGFVWTFLDEARDPPLVEPGAIVVDGDPDAPTVAEVVDIVDKPSGKVVHLRLLPGSLEDHAALIRRSVPS